MANDKTRTFEGKYTSKDGTIYTIKVRVFKRFAPLILAFVLVPASGKLITTIEAEFNPVDSRAEEQNPNIIVIDSIIRREPHILKDVERSDYKIKVGDTISAIAEKNSNTVARICALNNIDSKAIIYPGQEIRVETIKDKSPEDKEIAALQSYFYDYVFNSPIAELAKNATADGSDIGSIYKNFLYGKPKSEYELDPNSIYGEYINAYMQFHNDKEPNQESKAAYISTLTELAKKTHENLTLGSAVDSIVPYSQYKVYLENGTTKYDEIQNARRSIYN